MHDGQSTPRRGKARAPGEAGPGERADADAGLPHRHTGVAHLRRRAEIVGRLHQVCKMHTTAQIAVFTGTIYETTRRYLTDTATPSAPFLAALCDAMGVSAEWLLCGQGPTYRPAPSTAAPVTTQDKIAAVRAATVELERRLAQLSSDVQSVLGDP